MSADFWDASAQLVQAAIAGKGWGGGRAPTPVMKASLAEIARYLRDQNGEEIWRFTIITEDGRHIRSAELRELIRREDMPVQAMRP